MQLLYCVVHSPDFFADTKLGVNWYNFYTSITEYISQPQKEKAAPEREVNPKVWTAFLIKRLEFGIVLDSSRSVLI
ncbi:hypothetical protein, partial [Chitinophaga sp. CB10]|uniref:hypothetical protein n=1 Tax=Chitinophaga sp. CB10 TaxID=1891659 RepID=UPI0025BEC7CA